MKTRVCTNCTDRFVTHDTGSTTNSCTRPVRLRSRVSMSACTSQHTNIPTPVCAAGNATAGDLLRCEALPQGRPECCLTAALVHHTRSKQAGLGLVPQQPCIRKLLLLAMVAAPALLLLLLWLL